MDTKLVLLVCCAASLAVVLLSVGTTAWLLKRNSSLVELLLAEKDKHTTILTAEKDRHASEIRTLDEKFSTRLYTQREQSMLENTANLRQQLEYFSMAACGKPIGSDDSSTKPAG